MTYAEALDNVLTNTATYSSYNTLRYVAIGFFIMNVGFYLIKTMASKDDEIKLGYIYSRIGLLVFLAFYNTIIAFVHVPLNAICGADNFFLSNGTNETIASDMLFLDDDQESFSSLIEGQTESAVNNNMNIDAEIAQTIEAGDDGGGYLSQQWNKIGNKISSEIQQGIIDLFFFLGKICGAVVLSIRTAMLQILLGLLPIIIVISLMFSFEPTIVKWFELYVATLLMGAVVTLVELSVGASAAYMVTNLENGHSMIGIIQILAYLILIFSSYQFSKSIVSASTTWLTKHD